MNLIALLGIVQINRLARISADGMKKMIRYNFANKEIVDILEIPNTLVRQLSRSDYEKYMVYDTCVTLKGSDNVKNAPHH